ncbi:Para-aminobenzoate synthase component 1 [Serratia fonticola]|uniref:Para-aminobenzoate synthase component 1 n=1 Tax=Serratia fonticola TaxID=47917 RepID=A0A4U9W338_SERFO|nr:Para-aminobenzoate synthase component 1 [Serratia fonticola]
MNVTAPNLKSLPYTREAVLTLFAPLAQRPWAMLLHSGFAEHPHNRFDILVAEPRTTLTTYSASTEIQQGETRSNSPEEIPLCCCSNS